MCVLIRYPYTYIVFYLKKKKKKARRREFRGSSIYRPMYSKVERAAQVEYISKSTSFLTYILQRDLRSIL